jgi:uncharacterized repeat protein (TIGR03803 family)
MTEPVSGRKPVFVLLTRMLWAAALVLPALGTSAGVVLTTLHSFNGTNDGAGPNAPVQGSDGNFYGATIDGGIYPGFEGYGNGSVFKISTNGALTGLYSFTGGNDGANPFAGLVQGRDGNFYGTTVNGGIANAEAVFRLTIVPEFQPITRTNNTLILTWSMEAGGSSEKQQEERKIRSEFISSLRPQRLCAEQFPSGRVLGAACRALLLQCNLSKSIILKRIWQGNPESIRGRNVETYLAELFHCPSFPCP